ncbi:MAG TPA: protein kinase [Polyangiaceae bacterium]|jgi:tetratricopeptide (TPR) repeat protein|nr:protein kinase [Polyangiaceae bacterium]
MLSKEVSVPVTRASIEFGGTERFVLDGRIGEGGMGVVYRARDSETAVPVALKTMAYVEPAALLRFKNEFRALADISHPNVVQLYELVSEGEHWFFTMELLDGVDFLRWVHHGEAESIELRPLLTPWPEPGQTWDSVSPTLDAAQLPEATSSSSGVMSATRAPGAVRLCDVDRLRPALRQLAEGVCAIHAAGKLHRDIKPSNVLVTRDGRVVLLDFGVVGDLASARDNPRIEDQILGTPAYMAPEQARGAPAGTPVDWYGVGVMLYEALTDRLPFDGSPQDILFSKQGAQAVRPSEIVEGVPADLDDLCLDLLHPDPRKRPRGEDVRRRLAHGEESATRGSHPALTTGAQRLFVGRKEQLDLLDSAFASSAAGRAVVVQISGRSGMGKTTLAQRFLNRASRDRGALVLSGRCFEREALPFKGMDSVVDELSRFLSATPPRDIEELMPAGMHYLARIFPVLHAVPCMESVPQPAHEIVEPIELRKRAFAALKELLCTLGSEQPLVLHIDDVQWSDIDSLVLLGELLEPPNAPTMLLLCGFREELRHKSPILRELFALFERLGRSVDVRELVVDQLSNEEAVELATLALDGEQATPSELARAIALESHGVPIFVSELAQWQRERRARGDADAEQARRVSLEQVIQNRVADLPADASSLLEVLAVANGPVAYTLAEQAVGITRNDALRARLRAARLVRTFRADGREFAETYHARVRDSVVTALSAERLRACHGSLARALEASGNADPEALVEHYRGAGERENARKHVLTAARAAENGLAFMRAARLYRTAIELGADRPKSDLLASVGDALVNAGRSSEAADAYLEAAQAAPSEGAVELQRRAAEHLLKSGRDTEGLAVLREVLAAVELSYPESAPAALASLLYHRARLRLRGFSFSPTPAERCTPHALARVDVAFSATAGLAMVDVIRGADFGARQLVLALDSGEPIRICRALAFEAGNAAAVGSGSRDRIERLVRTAEGLALRSQDPHGTALAKVAAGLVRAFSGEWRSAQRMLDEAEIILRERCRAVTWELTNTQAWSCNSLILCGDLRAAAERVPAIVREATERSDRFALMHMIYPACITALAADDVERGWRVATDDSTFRSCEPGRFTAGHWGRLISTQSVHRYRGEGKRAAAFVENEWPGLVSSQFLRVHLMRVFSEFERALSLISALDEGSLDRDLERAAERSAKRVLGDSPEYAEPMGRYVAGCLAAVRADRDRALVEFERAASGLAAVDMGYLALCARQRYAELLGADSGRELMKKCHEDFGARGVVDINACLMMSAPGFRKLSA